MQRPVISLENLTVTVSGHFWQPQKTLVQAISLAVRPGEVLALVGANGAGKTTVIKAMLGLVRPQQGSVLVDGLPAHRPQARRALGYLPERFAFNTVLSAGEMVRLQARLAGVPRQHTQAAAVAALRQVGLADVATRRLKTFSKGMLQRAALAQALVHAPRILVLDEPMSGLDPQGRQDVRELIASQARARRTVVFTSHDLTDVTLLSHRVAVLHAGRLRYVGGMQDAALLRGGMRVTASRVPESLSAQAAAAGHRHESRGELSSFRCRDSDAGNALIDMLRQGGVAIVDVSALPASASTWPSDAPAREDAHAP